MKLKVIKKVKVAAVVMCVYVCRWRRTLDFWDLGRVSHLDDSCENSRSQHGGDLSTSLISMWATFESQIIMFHLHGLTGSSSRVEQIVFVLTFTCNLETFEGVEAVNPSADWRDKHLYIRQRLCFFAWRQMNFLSQLSLSRPARINIY